MLHPNDILQAPLYQPVPHPDFAGWAVCQPCTERMEMMRPHLPPKGTMIDAGCHTGFFCREFSNMGWRVIGFDKSEDWVGVARAMGEWDGDPKPEYRVGNILEMDLPACDVALCLSVAMYLFDVPDRGWSFFRQLAGKAKMTWLDFGGMYSNRLPFNEDDVCQKMKSMAGFRTCRMVGRTNFESRPLYLLE